MTHLAIRVVGADRPGITADLMSTLAALETDLEDVEQVLVRQRLILAAVVGTERPDSVRRELAAFGRRHGLSVQLDEVAGGVRVVTRPRFATWVDRLEKRGASDSRLSKSLVETLGIVAYKQPVGRAEVERIRGVQAGEALRALLERGLLKVVGRSDQPGRPLLYGTTERFLTVYGLKNLEDLPSPADLKRL